jgi:hypothetical protein
VETRTAGITILHGDITGRSAGRGFLEKVSIIRRNILAPIRFDLRSLAMKPADKQENKALRRVIRTSIGEHLKTYYEVTLQLPMSDKLATAVEYLRRRDYDERSEA